MEVHAHQYTALLALQTFSLGFLLILSYAIPYPLVALNSLLVVVAGCTATIIHARSSSPCFGPQCALYISPFILAAIVGILVRYRLEARTLRRFYANMQRQANRAMKGASN